MANSSDIIKIGFDYRASLAQFEKETNGVFDGISEKAGKQKIVIQLDAKNDKVIEKIKELQKLKLDKFTFEFGDSGIKEQLKTFGQLENKINEIINLSKGINNKSIGNGIGNSIVDEKSLNTVIDLFTKIESHLGSMKKVFSDVGDGEEFSPLLKMINNVQSAISELSTSVKGIGLNMNIDVGSDTEMEAKIQSKISNALQAYQRLFDAIKMSGVGGSVINTNFFEFDINQYDTMMGKLQAYRKFIENMRNEAKAQYNGKDVLYQSVDKSYWTQASAAMGQVTKAFNEMNATSDTNPLKDLFGSGDLSEVISQLGLIVAKLEEISTIASSFKNVFDNGFNVTASVEEIDKLTNRVKELEDELSNVKLNPVNVDKSNISSGTQIKDVFQGGIEEKSIDTLKAKIKEIFTDTDELKRVLKSLDEGSYFHLDWYKDSELKDFTDVDERIGKLIPLLKEYGYTIKNLNSSSDSLETSGSIVSLADENDKLEKITTSAKEAATSKEKFANANKEVKASADETVISVDKEISALEKAGSKFESQAAGLAIKPDDQHQFSSWKKQLEDLNIEIAEYKSKVENLSKIDIADEEQIKKAKTEIEGLGNSIKDAITSMTKTPQTKRGWTDIGASKAAEKVASVLKQNTKMSKEATDAIRAYYNELRSGNPSQPIDEILVKVNQLVQKERELGRVGKSFGEIFKEKVIYGGAAQLAGMVGFYDVINVGRDGIDTLKEFDDGLTKISYTMDMTKSQLNDLGKSVLDMANDLDSSINNAMQVSQIYANMNTSAEEIKKLSEPTLILSNLTGFDASTVADDIQAVTQQFDIAAESSMHIADVYDQISRNISVDYSKILELILETI